MDRERQGGQSPARRQMFNSHWFRPAALYCTADQKLRPSCWSKRIQVVGSQPVAEPLFPSEVWEKACTTVRKNHAITTRFLPQENAKSTEIRTYGVFPFVGGMSVRGMEEGLVWIIPLTIVPLTSLRPCPSSIGHLHVHFGSGRPHCVFWAFSQPFQRPGEIRQGEIRPLTPPTGFNKVAKPCLFSTRPASLGRAQVSYQELNSCPNKPKNL